MLGRATCPPYFVSSRSRERKICTQRYIDFWSIRKRWSKFCAWERTSFLTRTAGFGTISHHTSVWKTSKASILFFFLQCRDRCMPVPSPAASIVQWKRQRLAIVRSSRQTCADQNKFRFVFPAMATRQHVGSVVGAVDPSRPQQTWRRQ